MGKYGYSESKANDVKCIIENDFNSFSKKNIEALIDEFEDDKGNRTINFINYYNSIVLDHNDFNFGKFKKEWAIQGMKHKVFSKFDENFIDRKNEIMTQKDIYSFYEKYCCEDRKEFVFCCKLFHVILPDEFPPIDNNIIKHFKLNNKEKMIDYKIIKRGYDLFISKNEEKIKQIRQILSKEKYQYIRINELSNYRILDMIYWFKLARKPTIDRIGIWKN